jgi:hypothetical protein
MKYVGIYHIPHELVKCVQDRQSAPYKPDAKNIQFYQSDNSAVAEYSMEMPQNKF